MKHKVGDLVVLCDVSNRLKGPKYHLGYISNVRPPDNYYIYFFNMEKEENGYKLSKEYGGK